MGRNKEHSKVEGPSINHAKAHGWICHKLLDGSGEADNIFVKNGRCFYVEFKYGSGKQQDNQKIFERKAKINGTKYYVCYSQLSFLEILMNEEKENEILH